MNHTPGDNGFPKHEQTTSILPRPFGKLAGGMDEEGKQIEDKESRGQVFGPMPEIAAKVISIIFKYVEALVLDHPAGASAFGDLPHIVAVAGRLAIRGKLCLIFLLPVVTVRRSVCTGRRDNSSWRVLWLADLAVRMKLAP